MNRLAFITRRSILTAVAGVALGVAISSPGRAHHSASMFDQQRTLDVTAEVKEFQWTNPHVWIQVYVEDENGDRVEWSVEGGGRNSLARSGWRPTTFKPGDVVQMRFNPMRDGSPAGLFVGAKLADGSTIGRWYISYREHRQSSDSSKGTADDNRAVRPVHAALPKGDTLVR